MSRQCLIVAIAILASACAARGPSPQLVAEMAKAEAAFRAGCYTCLKEALAISERHLQAKQPPVGTRERAFDAALLIAIREKELGIPGDASMAKARQLRDRRRARPVLDAAELIIGDTTGLDPEQRAQRDRLATRPPLEPDNPKRRALDAAPDTDLAAKYVALSIDCEQPKLIESVDMQGVVDDLRRRAADAVPAVDVRPPGRAERRRAARTAIRAGPTRCIGKAAASWPRRSAARSISRRCSASTPQGREAFPVILMLTMAWANANLIGGGIRRRAVGVRRRAGDAADASRRAERPDAGAELPDASPGRDRHGDAAARARHVAHRRRQLLARVESLPPQGIRRCVGRRRERDQGPVEQPRLHAGGPDRLRAQGSADRRRSASIAPTSSTAAPAMRRGCRAWSASIRTSWRLPRRSSRAA